MPQSESLSPAKILPASAFTFDELTAAYNQTRVDYIVPMPMNVDRLKAYVHNYSVDMERSAVAVAGEHVLGLAMLGVREARTWITRLGVLPVKRRRGTGQLLMDYLIDQSKALGARTVWLEVIKDNDPAHTLFTKLGFVETRELLVLRRPPLMLNGQVKSTFVVEELSAETCLELLRERRDQPNWLNQTESLINVGNLSGLRVTVPPDGAGWLVFEHHPYRLGRLIIQPETGDFAEVTSALMYALHSHHTHHDTKHENMSVDDPRWAVLQKFGYLVAFRRIEMRLDLR